MDIKIIINEILSTGEALVANGSDAGPSLRGLQNQVYRFKVADHYLNFLCFFIFNFIEDLYFNLSGDFPYDEKLGGFIDRIFKEIGKLLIELASALNSNNFKDSYEIYVNMVRVYLDGLTQIENLVRE